MSYVDLKHLLADLSLEAVRQPDEAAWAAIVASYAGHANEVEPEVDWETVRQGASRRAAPFAWQPDEEALDFLIQRGLLRKHGERISAARPFIPHLAYLKRQAPRLLAVLAESNRTAEASVDVIRGVALFNGGLFFECHEYLEGVWKATKGPEKDFFHGIVQIAAAFYHFEKRNWHGARTLAEKGIRRLASYPDSHLGVDLGEFRRALHPWMLHFEGRKEGRAPEAYPKIELLIHERQEAPRG